MFKTTQRLIQTTRRGIRFRSGGLKGTGFNASELAREKEWINKREEELIKKREEEQRHMATKDTMAPLRACSQTLVELCVLPCTYRNLAEIHREAKKMCDLVGKLSEVNQHLP